MDAPEHGPLALKLLTVSRPSEPTRPALRGPDRPAGAAAQLRTLAARWAAAAASENHPLRSCTRRYSWLESLSLACSEAARKKEKRSVSSGGSWEPFAWRR